MIFSRKMLCFISFLKLSQMCLMTSIKTFTKEFAHQKFVMQLARIYTEQYFWKTSLTIQLLEFWLPRSQIKSSTRIVTGTWVNLAPGWATPRAWLKSGGINIYWWLVSLICDSKWTFSRNSQKLGDSITTMMSICIWLMRWVLLSSVSLELRYLLQILKQ